MTAIARVIRLITLAAAPIAIVAIQGAASAQEATPLPAYTGDRVYVKDVPNHYESVAKTIKDLERQSPQSYFVVVVKSSGAGPNATRDYLDRLYDAWRAEAETKDLKLDPERSVVVVAALDNRQVAVHPGTLLRDRFGLRGSTIDAEIVQRAFIPLARANDYPGALNALLTSTNNYLAAHGDAQTQAVATVEKTAAPAATTTTIDRRSAASTAVPAPPPASTANRDVAWSILGSFGALALLIGGLVWLAKRRARGSFNSKFKDYRSKAVAMMDRLDALKARLKSLPTDDPDFQEPMIGETLNHFEKVQGDLAKLWDRWLDVMDVVDKAQRKAGTKLEEADRLISDSKVFEEVEAGAKACGVAMDQLNNAHEVARKAAEEVVDRRTGAVAKVKNVGEAGLPPAPCQPEVDRPDALEKAAGRMLAPDPLGAKGVLAEALTAATNLGERAENIVGRLAGGKQVQAALEKLRADVAEQRRGGLRLDEEGGDPDHLIARSEQELAELQKALEAGDPDAAATRLEAGRALEKEARATLDAVQQAKSYCVREQPERERETRRLRESVPQYEAFEQELNRDFAPASWQVVAGNLAQARGLLDTFDVKAQEAAQATDGSSQKYLLGARLLGRLGQEQNAVFRLMNAVGERLTGLKTLRDDSRKAAADLKDRQRRAERFFSQYDHVVGAQARESLKAADEAGRNVDRESAERKPDWPAIRQALGKAVEEYAIAQSQAEADLKIYEVLTSEYDQARHNATRVQAFLAGHSEDRTAANQRYRIAEEVLNRVGDESTRVGNEWPRLLDQVRGAQADLEQSEQLAREDVRLARQAEAEIADGARTIRQARTYFSMGVTLNTSGAESLLNQAQQLYHSQNYEQAIRTAGAAVQQVRQAHNQAVQQAHIRQMQIQADQRRSAAGLNGFGMGVATGAAATMFGRAVSESGSAGDPGFLASGQGAATSPGDGGSDSSSSSWSTDSSESSW